MKRGSLSPSIADGGGNDGNSVSNKMSGSNSTNDRVRWAPIIVFLGPCFAEKKVMFGVPMEHISFRDTVELYEAAPLDTAIQIWNNTAHEGMLKALKHKIVGGLSVLDRLRSGPCDEQALLCLYFDQLITKKQLKERLSHIVRNEGILGSFLQAINRLKVDKPGLQLTRTVQLFIPEAQSAVGSVLSKKIKWATKYNPDIISIDDGNLIPGVYDIDQTVKYACKYGRKVRIARWGEEIPNVPLSDLILNGLVSFLQTGRYVDCATIAASYYYAERRRANAVGAVASQEDFVFDAGFVLDKDGFVTKFHRPHSSTTAASAPAFSLFSLFRGTSQQSTRPNAAKRNTVETSTKRRSSLLTQISSFAISTKGSPTQEDNIDPEHEIIERQIQRELGIQQPEPLAAEFTNSKISTQMSKLTAAAARNAHIVRQETNWVEFLNHKSVSIATTMTMSSASHHDTGARSALRRDSFASSASKSSATRSDKLHNSSSNSLQSAAQQESAQKSPTRPTDVRELGSYSYGLRGGKMIGKSSSSEATAESPNATIDVVRSLSSLSAGSTPDPNKSKPVHQGNLVSPPSAAQRALSSDLDDPDELDECAGAQQISHRRADTTSTQQMNQGLPPRSQHPPHRTLLTVAVPRSSQKASTARTGGSTVGVDPLVAAFGANKAARVKKEMLILTTAFVASAPPPPSPATKVSQQAGTAAPARANDHVDFASSVETVPIPSQLQHQDVASVAERVHELSGDGAPGYTVTTASGTEEIQQEETPRELVAVTEPAEREVRTEESSSPKSPSELSPSAHVSADGVSTAHNAKGVTFVFADVALDTPTPAARTPAVMFQAPPAASVMRVPEQAGYAPTVKEVETLKAYEKRLKEAENKLKIREDAVSSTNTSSELHPEIEMQRETSTEMSSVKAKAMAIENRVKSRSQEPALKVPGFGTNKKLSKMDV